MVEDFGRDRVGARWPARLAAGTLLLLAALATYAPLIAGDRPYTMVAIDRGGYEAARRGLVAVTASLRELARVGPGGLPEGETRRYEDVLDEELGALSARVRALCVALPEDAVGPPGGESLQVALGALEDRAGALVASALAGTPSGAAGAEQERAADALLEAARALRRGLEVRQAGDAAGVGVELQGRRSFPLFAALAPLEVGAMVGLPLLVLAGWRGRGRRHRAAAGGRSALVGLGLALLAASAVAFAWHRTVGPGDAFDAGRIKADLTSGRIESWSARFPPLALGFAETHVDESFRPPTWLPSAELDEAGRYVRGPRSPRPDPSTGELPASAAVEVRFGEPARNAAHRHLLGTDESGRDLAVRLLYGGRVSLLVGLASSLLVVSLGVLVGALAGWRGGRVDALLSRGIEVVQCIPAFLLVLVAAVLLPPDGLHPVLGIVLVLGLVGWTGIARLVRAEVLRLRDQDFVLAARATGLPGRRILVSHVLPNALGPVLVAGTFAVAGGILAESAVSFLGFGVREPTPSWGALLSESRALEHWWMQVFPGLAICVTVLAVNALGEALRERLDPRAARHR